MTIRHLTVFAAVAEQGSMSAAAKHLYLSQPTVSQAIRELEAHYNGLLFERLGKKLYLTERGKLLLPHAREMIRQFQQLEELILDRDTYAEKIDMGNKMAQIVYEGKWFTPLREAVQALSWICRKKSRTLTFTPLSPTRKISNRSFCVLSWTLLW